MVLFKPSNVFESQYKNQCYLPARTYWITSQTSPGIHASGLCWRYRTFASRDFSELSCLFQDFASLPVSLEFFFLYLFETKLCIFASMITLLRQCASGSATHLVPGAWDLRTGLSRSLMTDTRLPVQPPPTSSHCSLPSLHQGNTGWATTQLPVASAERTGVTLSPRLGMLVYAVHFEKYCLCVHTGWHKCPKPLQMGDQVYKKP